MINESNKKISFIVFGWWLEILPWHNTEHNHCNRYHAENRPISQWIISKKNLTVLITGKVSSERWWRKHDLWIVGRASFDWFSVTAYKFPHFPSRIRFVFTFNSTLNRATHQEEGPKPPVSKSITANHLRRHWKTTTLGLIKRLYGKIIFERNNNNNKTNGMEKKETKTEIAHETQWKIGVAKWREKQTTQFYYDRCGRNHLEGIGGGYGFHSKHNSCFIMIMAKLFVQ